MPAQHSPTHTNVSSAHWHILGIGAIGTLFAFYLQERAHLIVNANSPYAKQNTLTLHLQKQTITSTASFSCSTAAQANNIQRLLICTKAHQTEQALEGLHLADATQIVLLQNGLGNHSLLKKRFPQCSIFCGTTTHGAFRTAPLHIVHAGEGNTYIGSFEATVTEKQIEALCHSLSTSQHKIQSDMHIEKRLWLKLAMNCAINPLTVIYQCKNGELLSSEQRLKHLKNICTEVDSILHKKQLLDPNESCFDRVVQVAKDTGNNYSSMLQDNQHKRLSEIDFIQGYLLKEAKTLGLNLIENQQVFDTIKKIEAAY